MKYRRFYVTGDTHGEPGRFMYTNTAFEKIADSGDILFIAGDFGFVWDNSPEEQAIREIIAEKKYTTCFVDGNHENFDTAGKLSCQSLVWRQSSCYRRGAGRDAEADSSDARAGLRHSGMHFRCREKHFRFHHGRSFQRRPQDTAERANPGGRVRCLLRRNTRRHLPI